MQRFGDRPQTLYEEHVRIGFFEFKLDPIKIEWLGHQFSFETTMYVEDQTAIGVGEEMIAFQWNGRRLMAFNTTRDQRAQRWRIVPSLIAATFAFSACQFVCASWSRALVKAPN
jgi:hypothetical protein